MSGSTASDSPTTTNPSAHIANLAYEQPVLPVELNLDGFPSQDEKHASGLATTSEARALVRLIQCPVCSLPFNTPVTLPCGRSLCRSCLPPSHERAHITWPDLPDRRQAIPCPFPVCGEQHTVADCCMDVVLHKIMDALADIVATQNSLVSISSPTEASTERAMTGIEFQSADSTACGLIALYNLAAAGQLPYATEAHSSPSNTETMSDTPQDDSIQSNLLDVCLKELDCQVCYNLMLDPVTTSCGHTLCRRCLVRSLDHSMHCPVCRRMLLIAPSLHTYPSNHTLRDLMNALCPNLVAARKEAITSEEHSLLGDFDIPLFVVTLGFPGCPTFLRVFEPRYRLMLRRALEGNRTFGMVMYNQTGASQGELGRSSFMQYGTLLRIENAQLMPDGTSIIETRGVSRFKVISSGVLDGYAVGRVERVEDMPVSEEEAIEAQEISLPPIPEGITDLDGQLARMSTQELLRLGLDFVERMRTRSAPWLREGILSAYGGPPNDAVMFPYWFASILPTDDTAKYQILQTTSVRQRLKMTAKWVRLMENQRWWANLFWR